MVEYRKDKVKIFLNELEEFKKIETEKDLQKYFEGLAITLFNQIDILAGKARYSLAEIEFYYQNGIFKDGQYKDTYARTKSAGSLFWHLSGIDICFESKEKEDYYGGILIRSIIKEDGSLITGPMCCSDELLNSCVQSSSIEKPSIIPILVDKETELNIEPLSTIRQGIEADRDGLEFCFYIKRDSWTNYKGNYYSARPDKRKK
jgi:hypothetical protein